MKTQKHADLVGADAAPLENPDDSGGSGLCKKGANYKVKGKIVEISESDWLDALELKKTQKHADLVGADAAPLENPDDSGGSGLCKKDVLHMYKNILQQYALKENLGLPVYTFEAEGPPHACRFKSKVTVNGKSYETSDYFPTMKEAEKAAAKIACQALLIDDKGLYKNLLQELAQKKGLPCPSYKTHMAGFTSTVEIGSNVFQGSEAKTKKQAEMNAAKVAYNALTKERMIGVLKSKTERAIGRCSSSFSGGRDVIFMCDSNDETPQSNKGAGNRADLVEDWSRKRERSCMRSAVCEESSSDEEYLSDGYMDRLVAKIRSRMS